ncbi:MAG: hypothetical protein US89_C0006G0054 [Candidatus Peregrinibacteria bacterium GW2011_GWF2_38_29]|nr:MAG: hypothetical protein US89_C0006G0054 [Candidatus Peregrinibacteria bacterium GW2011_GWF2_38_29]HBB03245.1 hypothetical protein [Candidatus Peregrinibacteria bacterium]
MNRPSAGADEGRDILHQQTIMLSEIDEKTRDRLVELARAVLAGEASASSKLRIMFQRTKLPYPDAVGLQNIIDANDLEVVIPENTDEIVDACIDGMDAFQNGHSPYGIRAFLSKAIYEVTGKVKVRLAGEEFFDLIAKCTSDERRKIIKKIYLNWEYAASSESEIQGDNVVREMFIIAAFIAASAHATEDDLAFSKELYREAIELKPELEEEKKKQERANEVRRKLAEFFQPNARSKELLESEDAAKEFVGLMTEYTYIASECSVGVVRIMYDVFALSLEAQMTKDRLQGKPVPSKGKTKIKFESAEKIYMAMLLAEYGGPEYADAFNKAVIGVAHEDENRVNREAMRTYSINGGEFSRRVTYKYLTKETGDHKKAKFEAAAYVPYYSRGLKNRVEEAIKRSRASGKGLVVGDRMVREVMEKSIVEEAIEALCNEIVMAKNESGKITKEDVERVMDKVKFMEAAMIIKKGEVSRLRNGVRNFLEREGVANLINGENLKDYGYYDPDNLGEKFYTEGVDIFINKLGNRNAEVNGSLVQDHYALGMEYMHYLVEMNKLGEGTDAELAYFRKHRRKYEIFAQNVPEEDIINAYGGAITGMAPIIQREMYEMFFKNLKTHERVIRYMTASVVGRDVNDESLRENAKAICKALFMGSYADRNIDFLIQLFHEEERASFYGSGRALSVYITPLLKDRKLVFKKLLTGAIKSEDDLKDARKSLKINRSILANLGGRFKREFMEEFCTLPIFWEAGGARTSAVRLAAKFFEEDADVKLFTNIMTEQSDARAEQGKPDKTVPATRELASSVSAQIAEDLETLNRTEQISEMSGSLKICKKRVMGDGISYKGAMSVVDTPLNKVFKKISIKKTRNGDGKITYAWFLTGQNEQGAYTFEGIFDENNKASFIFRRKGMPFGKNISHENLEGCSERFLQEIEYVVLVFLKTFYDEQPEMPEEIVEPPTPVIEQPSVTLEESEAAVEVPSEVEQLVESQQELLEPPESDDEIIFVDAVTAERDITPRKSMGSVKIDFTTAKDRAQQAVRRKVILVQQKRALELFESDNPDMDELKAMRVYKKYEKEGGRMEYRPCKDTVTVWQEYKKGLIQLSEIFAVDVDPFSRILGYAQREEERRVDPGAKLLDEALRRGGLVLPGQTETEGKRLEGFIYEHIDEVPGAGVVELTAIVKKQASKAALGLHDEMAISGIIEGLDLSPAPMGQLEVSFDRNENQERLFQAALRFFSDDPELKIIEQEKNEKLRLAREALVEALNSGKPGRAFNIVQEIGRIEAEAMVKMEEHRAIVKETLARLKSDEIRIVLVQPCQFEVQRTYVQGSYLSLQELKDGKRKRVRKTKSGEATNADGAIAEATDVPNATEV